jgi:hypothetical protein
MGYSGASSYSGATRSATAAAFKAAGLDEFVHKAAIDSGAVPKAVHALLDPSKKNTVGKLTRESFDSDANPTSRAVAVILDVTGSQNTVPQEVLAKLPTLMSLLVAKGILEYPHVMFGAVGDATCDTVPLQIGQFETGQTIDSSITHIYPEGGGGGQNTESYELAMFFLARYADMDCFNKRGDKGFLFLTGDELPYGKVSKAQVKQHIGVEIEADIPTKDILAELQEKFEVFWIIAKNTSNFNNRTINETLKEMFGERFLKLEDTKDVCELIAATVALTLGVDMEAITDALKGAGASASGIKSASMALEKYAGTPKAVTKATANQALVPAGTDAVERL